MGNFSKALGKLLEHPKRQMVRDAGKDNRMAEFCEFENHLGRSANGELVLSVDECVATEMSSWVQKIGNSAKEHFCPEARVMVTGNQHIRREINADGSERISVRVDAEIVTLPAYQGDGSRVTKSPSGQRSCL